jgi:hypothetical protein
MSLKSCGEKEVAFGGHHLLTGKLDGNVASLAQSAVTNRREPGTVPSRL